MITRYDFKNFCSFKELSIFELLAPANKVKNRFPDNFTKTNYGLDVLKTIVIVGENAGGKSNLIKSINFFKAMFKTNERIKSYKDLINFNNNCSDNIDDCDTSQYFHIEILINDILYLYSLTIDYIGIKKEVLSVKKTNYGKEYTVFDCIRNLTKENNQTKINYNFGFDTSKYNSSIFTNSIRENNIGLFINKLALLGELFSSEFVNYINNNLFADEILYTYNLYKDFKKEEDDQRIIKDSRFLNILKMIDPSIINLEVNEEHPFTKSKIIRNNENNQNFSRVLEYDSSGVIEFFAWAVQIFRVVYEDKVVFADEMDRVLNPVLSDKIISFINSKNHKGQLIITTHNALHLDLKKYMKEQIYFVSKDIDTLNSQLYSLADFPDVRYETTKIHEFYMKGILGGTFSG